MTINQQVKDKKTTPPLCFDCTNSEMNPSSTYQTTHAIKHAFAPMSNQPARNRPKAILAGTSLENLNNVWGEEQMARLNKLVELLTPVPWDGTPATLPDDVGEVEVIFSTWGMVRAQPEMLELMPSLRAVFFAAGSVREFAQPFLDRGVRIFSAWAANAVPVAEFTLSQILFGLKQGWLHHRLMKETAGPDGWKHQPVTGAYLSSVGLISLGMIGRRVCRLLEAFELRRVVYDPFIPPDEITALGLEAASLEEIFARCDVVSLHCPSLPSTNGLITGELLASMKPRSTFINTARGAIVREQEMIEVLRLRPDLTAILDVTQEEPPPAGSPLYDLPNVVLTPHIAGSLGPEVRRMADWMLDECSLWIEGKATRYEVVPERFNLMA